MLNHISSSVSDSLAMCPEYKVVSEDQEGAEDAFEGGGRGGGEGLMAWDNEDIRRAGSSTAAFLFKGGDRP
ncbi:MAG: hypothetical protein IPO90_17370 [Flavobacteriales bacterium]|nr:hypothetical protein [Flavobacteriales bacterium]